MENEKQQIHPGDLFKELAILFVSMMICLSLLFKALGAVIKSNVIQEASLPGLTLFVVHVRYFLIHGLGFLVVIISLAVISMLTELMMSKEHKVSFAIYRTLNALLVIFNFAILISIFLPFSNL